LALYYYGENKTNKETLINETSSGALDFNDCIFHATNHKLPFGGVGNSGTGSLHGKFGFKNCSHLKPILDKKTGNGFPANVRFPPYTNDKLKIIKFGGMFGDIYNRDIKNTIFKILLFILFVFIISRYHTRIIDSVKTFKFWSHAFHEWKNKSK